MIKSEGVSCVLDKPEKSGFKRIFFWNSLMIFLFTRPV